MFFVDVFLSQACSVKLKAYLLVSLSDLCATQKWHI